MSKIQSAILAACASLAAPKAGANRQVFLTDSLRAIDKLDDKAYGKLDDDVVGWFNKAADVAEANKNSNTKDDLPEFPDFKDEPASGSSRRRRAAEDDDAGPPVVKEGMEVTVVTKRGREYKGKVVEKTDEFIALQVPGEDGETEIDMDKVETIKVFNDGKAGEEPSDPLSEGATVKVVTKRGRTVTGEIVKIDDDEVVLKTDEGEEDFPRSRVESITPVGGAAKKPKAEEPETSTRRRSTASADDKPKGDEKPARSRNEGVSIGMRIKELIADNLGATKEQIAKLLDKEKLEYRPNTLDLAYAECHKFIAVLKEKKLLKA